MQDDQSVDACHAPSLTIRFGSFLRMGITAFGGPAIIAYIRRKAVTQNQWIDEASFQDGVALCQVIPGATVMQMAGPTFLNGIVLGQFTPGLIVITATFVGYLVYGLSGAIVATAAIFLPSFLILVGIAPYFDRFRASSWFARAIGGILCSFVGLLLTVTLHLALNVHWDFFHLAIAGASFAALIFKLDILWVVLAGTAVSILVL